jgi:hypothetical protein
MTNDAFPTVQLRNRISVHLITAAVLICLLIYMGLVAKGIIVDGNERMNSRERLTPGAAEVDFIIFSAGLFWTYVALLRRCRAPNPALTISRDGVFYPAVSLQLIPWSLVKAIDVHPFKESKTVVVADLLLVDDLPDNLRSEIIKKCPLAQRPESIVITVISRSLAGMVEMELIEALKRYWREFGPTTSQG